MRLGRLVEVENLGDHRRDSAIGQKRPNLVRQGGGDRRFVGRTPRPQVERYGHIVLIDTGAVYGGLLTAFCPETDALVQVPGAPCSTSFPRPQDEGRIPAVLAGEPSTC